MTDRLAAFMALTRWTVISDYGDDGIGGADPFLSFTEAASEWADRMDHGYPSLVLEQRLNTAEIDVTDAARKTAAGWIRGELPDWAMEKECAA